MKKNHLYIKLPAWLHKPSWLHKPTVRQATFAIKALATAVVILTVFLLISIFNNSVNASAKANKIATQNASILAYLQAAAISNHQLAVDNKAVNQQNRDYIACLAQLFAKYTQNQMPVTIIDLNTCAALQTGTKSKPANNKTGTPQTNSNNPPTAQQTTQQQQSGGQPQKKGALSQAVSDVKNTVESVVHSLW